MKGSKAICVVFIAAAALIPAHALAVDGVVLIDQNRALAGSITPGDAAGFPVTISQPGSYRLSGNLTVPDQNTTAILITASHVTIDLNGFAILGPTDCSGNLNPCAAAGTGRGIATPGTPFLSGGNVPVFNVTIRNGTVQGMGDLGIFLQGDSHLVEQMHVRSNGNGGILIESSQDAGTSIVQNNTLQRNGRSADANAARNGIQVLRGAVRNNVVDASGTSGINVSIGSVSYNVSTRNAFGGVNLGSGTSYVGNVFRDNAPQDVLGGGINQGQNLCGLAVCPGAQF